MPRQHMKPLLTPGQAILLVMSEYEPGTAEYAELRRLYVCGADSPQATRALRGRWFRHPVLQGYPITYHPDKINKDPIRRIFETRLSFHTFTESVERLSYPSLENLKGFLERIIFRLGPQHLEHAKAIMIGQTQHATNADEIDYGIFFTQIMYAWRYAKYAQLHEARKHNPLTPIDFIEFFNPREYDLYARDELLKNPYCHLSADSCTKLAFTVQCAFLSVFAAQRGAPMPLDIYLRDIVPFKGCDVDPSFQSTRKRNHGICKGIEPRIGINVDQSKHDLPNAKSSNKARPNISSRLVRAMFEQWVHPFSNGISGTMLCFLRVLALIEWQGHSHFEHDRAHLVDHLRVMVSGLLFVTGGHSLYEYTSTLWLPAVREAFAAYPWFVELNLETIFIEGNLGPLDMTLNDLIKDNLLYIQHQTSVSVIKREGLFAASQRTQRVQREVEQAKQTLDEIKRMCGDGRPQSPLVGRASPEIQQRIFNTK